MTWECFLEPVIIKMRAKLPYAIYENKGTEDKGRSHSYIMLFRALLCSLKLSTVPLS